MPQISDNQTVPELNNGTYLNTADGTVYTVTSTTVPGNGEYVYSISGLPAPVYQTVDYATQYGNSLSSVSWTSPATVPIKVDSSGNVILTIHGAEFVGEITPEGVVFRALQAVPAFSLKELSKDIPLIFVDYEELYWDIEREE